jgi:hypothetical protein
MNDLWRSIKKHPLLAGAWACVALIYLALVPFRSWSVGDTYMIARSVAPALACAKAGQFVGCKIDSPFPLAQYFPSFAMGLVGLRPHLIVAGLILVSAAAFAGIFCLGLWMFRTDRRARLLFTLLLVTGPLWAYGNCSLGETLAAFLTLLFAIVCIKRPHSWLMLLAFVAAGLTKETAAPMLFLLGLAAGPQLQWPPKPELRRHVYFLLAGFALAVCLSGLWNVFRYGVPLNLEYAKQAAWNIDVRQNLRFFAALWVCPNAGLLVFWTTWTVTSAAIVAVARTARAWLVVLVLLLVTAGLCRWWAPFGWSCYGQRLMLPWLPACAAVLIYHERPTVERLLDKIARHRLAVVATVLVCLATAMPHLLASQDWRSFSAAIDAHSLAAFPVLRDHVNPEVNAWIYYRDSNLVIWSPKTSLFEVVREGLSHARYYPWLLLTLFCIADLARRLVAPGRAAALRRGNSQ